MLFFSTSRNDSNRSTGGPSRPPRLPSPPPHRRQLSTTPALDGRTASKQHRRRHRSVFSFPSTLNEAPGLLRDPRGRPTRLNADKKRTRRISPGCFGMFGLGTLFPRPFQPAVPFSSSLSPSPHSTPRLLPLPGPSSQPRHSFNDLSHHALHLHPRPCRARCRRLCPEWLWPLPLHHRQR